MIAVGALCLFALFGTGAYGQETVTLTVNSAYGSPDPAVGVHSYAAGTGITASVATPVAGGPGTRYTCVGWKAKGSPQSVGHTNTVTFTISINSVLTWRWKAQYLLTVNVAPEAHCVPGYVDIWSEDQETPTDGYWGYKRVAQLRAVENEGYDFAYWTGGSLAVRMDPTANPTAQQMRRPETITAIFVPEPRNFTVISAQGEPSLAVGTYALHYDDLIEANCGENPYPAGDGAQYVCTGHDGTGDVSAGSETSISFYLHHDSSVTWLWQLQYVLIIDSLYGNPQGAGWHNAGDTASWSVTSPYPVSDGVCYFTDDPSSGEFVMDSPKSVPVSWRLQYRLITAANSPEQGSVLPEGENWYDAGTEVSLTVTANAGYTFVWSGDLSGTETSIIMDGPKSITANFYKPTLTVSNPSGFDTPSPAVGTYTFDAGSTVSASMSTPEVNPIGYGIFTEGFESGLSGWTMGGTFNWFLVTEEKHSGSYSARSGGIGSNKSTYIERSFTIGSGGGQVTFWWKVSSRPAYHTLKFYIDGSLYESISGVVGWVERTFSLAAGTRTLRWEYTKDWRSPQNLDRGWIDDIAVTNIPYVDVNTKYVCTGYTGTGSCPSSSGSSVTFTIDTNSSITWNWMGQFKLFTEVEPAGWGTVTVSPVQDWYDEGSSVQLTAIPSAEIRTFEKWTGDLTGFENPLTITMDGTKRITANFIPNLRALVVTSPYGSPNPPVGTSLFEYSSSVTVSCGPNPYAGPAGTQYVCTGWTDGSGDIPATGSASSYGPFTITQNCVITWTWNTQYQLTTAVNPAGSGTVTPASGSWHDAGAVISCTASLNVGWRWLEWSGDLTSTENPKSLTMDSPKSVTANFVWPPVANFTATPTVGIAPLTVNFTDTSTGTITSWTWDFNNDGTTDSTAQHPVHVYGSQGTYTVSLTVTGPDGSDAETKTNYITVTSPGATICVDRTYGRDTNNGLSWATAVKTIQRGLDLAGTSGWTVLVANGTYTGTGNKSLNFNGKAIRLKSAGGAANCIINCENSGWGLLFCSGETSDAVVDGFTVQNGKSLTRGGGIFCVSSPTITNCIIANCLADYEGGGICCWGAACKAIITSCTITGNTGTENGGGVCCVYSAAPTITNCTIVNNTSKGWGGGIYCESSAAPLITNCTVASNTADGPSGGRGGGICCEENSCPTIRNCTIKNNFGDSCGGGIYCIGGSSPTIGNCIISGNSAAYGGGVECERMSNPVIANCIIVKNVSVPAGAGGGIHCNNSSPTVINCTIADNNTSFYGGGICCSAWGSNNPVLNNTILWGNTAASAGNQVFCPGNSSVTLNYCTYDNGLNDIVDEGIVTSNNCISSDPAFADAANGDYRLRNISPCIDAGSSILVSYDCDLDGNPRLEDGDSDGTSAVDIGAYEYQVGGNNNPAVTIETSPNGTTADDTPTFIYSGSDGDGMVTGYWVSVDVNPPGTFTTDASWTSPSLSPGWHAFYVQAQDNAGGKSLIKMRSFVYDITPATRLVPGEYITIQQAIDAAEDGETVLVADGIYKGAGNRDLNFKGGAITVKSENGPLNCIIDCENSATGFCFHSEEIWSSVVEGVTIRNANSRGSGGAIFCYYSSPSISNCVITGNTAAKQGGGIYWYVWGDSRVTNCIITNNTALGKGGGIYCYSSDPVIMNCAITNNVATHDGGGIYSYGQPKLINCTIANNIASGQGGGFFSYYSKPTLNNTIVWGNNAGLAGKQIYTFTVNDIVALNYSDYANSANDIAGSGTVMPTNCLTSDPQFVDAANKNYHLQSASPCIDRGNNFYVPAGVTTDLDGNPRIVDGNTPPDGTAIVDIGAYEYQP
jgi:parallel beta-helix repeat protein